ncbi:MAG: hypothetical protein LPD71_09170 [Shewanella sp.]|nr:hypothetical protein [Shewanella sp.]MCF1431914.1 hypothetical protein [Shewanella sp.]MCF1438896.1 hypothetical protein [Shewanella sp.]MCF1457522.1 hypothetical protein [Shewanella sp.]
MGTARKQQQIKEILARMQMSIQTFAGLVYEELRGDDDKGAEAKLAANIKKQLQRSTTSESLLDQYLEILSVQPGFEALELGHIKLRYVVHECLSDELTQAMVALSDELDEREG